MKGPFNLSEWALRHQSFVWYLMFVALLMGVFSYMNLGREEDPSFTIKTMICLLYTSPSPRDRG